VNEVRLVGKVSAAPQLRELPSGDAMVSFRVVVGRPESAYRGAQRVDVIECAVWSGRIMRSVQRWSDGDVVEVTGAIRRRFYKAGAGTSSRVEIEVRTARLIRHSASA
jgi:single-strand DNA-binding protein